jgi:hypothetical protein
MLLPSSCHRFPVVRCLLVILLAVCAVSSAARAGSAHPYAGEWSNGRGETLVVTRETIQFGDDEAVSYRDITRATDGSIFELHITESGRVNGFSGKYLSVSCERVKMKITGYRSHADLMQDENQQQEVTWFKDKSED